MFFWCSNWSLWFLGSYYYEAVCLPIFKWAKKLLYKVKIFYSKNIKNFCFKSIQIACSIFLIHRNGQKWNIPIDCHFAMKSCSTINFLTSSDLKHEWIQGLYLQAVLYLQWCYSSLSSPKVQRWLRKSWLKVQALDITNIIIIFILSYFKDLRYNLKEKKNPILLHLPLYLPKFTFPVILVRKVHFHFRSISVSLFQFCYKGRTSWFCLFPFHTDCRVPPIVLNILAS